jgi:hypothetical protein
MNIEELFGKDYHEFCEIDPFNTQNEVGGYISRKATEYYGALVITHINGIAVKEQLIMGTPKMHYPFTTAQTGERKYSFPAANKVEVFEKLDGTNILVYSYTNGDDVFYTCKTRLLPFINAGSKWGNFFAMWEEVAKDVFDYICDLMAELGCNLSFELYGARNPHLVIYDIPLAYALLFGVTNVGNIISPSKIKCNLPKAKLVAEVDKDYSNTYINIQKQLESGLCKLDNDTYMGVEGTVWYLQTIENRTVQYKCKPETIEVIHFSQGKGISKNSILATCWNALENTDKLTVDFIKQLLLEEFEAPKIEANHYLIESCIKVVEDALVFRDRVLNEYRVIGMDIKLDKVAVMRKMSGKFDRNEMSKVYTTIMNWG